MSIDKMILSHLLDLGGIATRNNLYSPKATTYSGALQMVNIHINKFIKAGMIEGLEPQLRPQDKWREVFYAITKKGALHIGREDEWKRGRSKVKSPYNVFHESMARDVALSFIRLYPDFTPFIRFDEIFKKGDISVKPDLTVRLKKDDITYCFLIEIERKKTFDREKQNKYEQLFKDTKPEKYGLPHFFKVLFIYAPIEYNCLLRPQEYKNHSDKVEKARNYINNIVGLSKQLSEVRYRFLSFPDFYRLNEPIWLTPAGNKVPLITQDN